MMDAGGGARGGSFLGAFPPQDLLAAVLFSLHTWHDPWARHAKVHGGG